MKTKVVSQVSFTPLLSGAYARATPLVDKFVFCLGLRNKASERSIILLISGKNEIKRISDVNDHITATTLSYAGLSAGVN